MENRVIPLTEIGHTSVANESLQAPIDTLKPDHPQPLLSAARAQIKNEYRTLMGNPAEAAQVESWFMLRGNYALGDGNLEYLGYSRDVLESLVKNGDIRAMHALARLDEKPPYIGQYGKEGYESLYWRAAAYGSTAAFTNLAIGYEVEHYDYEKNVISKRSAAIEILALYNVAELRGDKWANISDAVDFRERLIKDGVDFTQLDQQSVNERSQQLYADLQEKRNTLGLGGFDNSTPEVVNKFYDRWIHSKQNFRPIQIIKVLMFYECLIFQNFSQSPSSFLISVPRVLC